MVKKLIAALMVFTMAMAVFSGCSGTNSATNSAAPAPAPAATESSKTTEAAPAEESAPEVTLKIHTLVNPQSDEATVFEALNKLTKEKLNTTVNYVFHGGTYGDKIQVIIASGEEYDICFTSSWSNIYNINVAKGAFVDITEMLPTVAPKLQQTLPEYIWKATKINGKIYAVPNQQIVARAIPMLAPVEYIEGTGVDAKSLKNIASSTDYFQKAYDKYGVKFAGITSTQMADYFGYEYISDSLSAGAIKMTDSSAKVVNIYETEEYLATLNELADLSAKGLLDGQSAYDPQYGESQRKAKKFSGLMSGAYKPGGDAEETARAGYPCVLLPLQTNPYVSTGGVIATMQGISTSSKNPERALQYLELLSTDADVLNTLVFGVEGEHYTKLSDNMIAPIADSGYATGMSWALGNVFNSFVMEGQPEDVWAQTKALNDSATQSPILGFSFDPEPVKLQVASVGKVVKEYESICGGELPVESTLKAFNEKLKVAGVDEVIAEMQKQIDAFMATK